jgi:hypothetical protein
MVRRASGEWPLLKGTLAGAFIGTVIAATIAGTWAAYSYSYSYAAMAANSMAADEPGDSVPQAPNAEAKADRLSVAAPAAVAERFAAPPPETAAAPASYAVAALRTTAVDLPKPQIEPRIETRKPVAVLPPEKPKRTEQQKLLLDDAQIASLRTRLKLTPAQEEFWPAVEVTLRDVIHAHARKSRKASRGVAQIDVNSPEVQQLISAAVPLIMRLSEEQKREVRQLARVIGLETVASKI